MTMGRGLEDMMSSVACKPSTCGMLMSMVMTSGFSDSDWATASRPSRASPTTSSCGSLLIMLCSTLRMKAESSTIKTRIRFSAIAFIAGAKAPVLSRSQRHG